MCDCINQINTALKDRNAKLETSFLLGENPKTVVSVTTVKADKTNKMKPVSVIPSHCCFCGEGLFPERQSVLKENQERALIESANEPN